MNILDTLASTPLFDQSSTFGLGAAKPAMNSGGFNGPSNV